MAIKFDGPRCRNICGPARRRRDRTHAHQAATAPLCPRLAAARLQRSRPTATSVARSARCRASRWRREPASPCARGGRPVAAWPPDGPAGSAALAASRLTRGGEAAVDRPAACGSLGMPLVRLPRRRFAGAVFGGVPPVPRRRGSRSPGSSPPRPPSRRSGRRPTAAPRSATCRRGSAKQKAEAGQQSMNPVLLAILTLSVLVSILPGGGRASTGRRRGQRAEGRGPPSDREQVLRRGKHRERGPAAVPSATLREAQWAHSQRRLRKTRAAAFRRCSDLLRATRGEGRAVG